MQTQAKHVDFTKANVDRCQCTNCPVQADSACATQARQRMQGQDVMAMSSKDVPNVYCAQGTAACGDLDFSHRCICPTCEVWNENELSNYKYCQNGDAEKIG